MRPNFPDRADGLVSLTLARLRAGERPPLDWMAAAVERGALVEAQTRSSGASVGRRRRILARLGLSVSEAIWSEPA